MSASTAASRISADGSPWSVAINLSTRAAEARAAAELAEGPCGLDADLDGLVVQRHDQQ